MPTLKQGAFVDRGQGMTFSTFGTWQTPDANARQGVLAACLLLCQGHGDAKLQKRSSREKRRPRFQASEADTAALTLRGSLPQLRRKTCRGQQRTAKQEMSQLTSTRPNKALAH